jgi:hypothetical protein
MKNIITVLALCLMACGTPAIMDTMDSSPDSRQMEIVPDATDTASDAVSDSVIVSDAGQDVYVTDTSDTVDQSDAAADVVTDVATDLGSPPTDSGTCTGCFMPGTSECVERTVDHCGTGIGLNTWCMTCPTSTDSCNVAACDGTCTLRPTQILGTWTQNYPTCSTAGMLGYCEPDPVGGYLSGYPVCTTLGLPGHECSHGTSGEDPSGWGCMIPNPLPMYDSSSIYYADEGPWQPLVFQSGTCPLSGTCPM